MLHCCDGCGLNVTKLNDENLCAHCIKNRKDDAAVFVHGRNMMVSELQMQAETDETLVPALDGDTVQMATRKV